MSEEEMKDQLLPHQFEDIYDEEDAPIMDFRKRILKKFAYIGTGVFILFVLGATFLKIPKHLNFEFTLKTKEKEYIGQFDHKLYVVEKNQTTGTYLEEGSPVITVTSQLIVEYLSELEQAQIAYQLFLVEKENLSTTQLHIKKLTLSSYQKQKNLLQVELNQLQKTFEADIKQLNFELTQQEKSYKRQKQLFEKKVIPDADFEKAESEYEATKNNLAVKNSRYKKDIASLENDLETCKYDIEIQQKEITSFLQNQELRENELKRKIEAIQQKLSYTFGNYSVSEKGLVLNAPFDGNLSYIFEGEKEVPMGAILFMVSNTRQNLYAQSAIPPEFIGMVKDGSRVVLKVASFPHYEYGVLRASVNNLSQTPNIEGNYPFEAQINDFGNLKPFLQKGMNGQLSVVVDEKSLFGYFFERLNKKYTELVDN
jgi:hypothetical protein